MQFINELMANPAVQTALASAAGTLVAIIVAKGGGWLKAIVLKTENKVDDALLEAITKAVKDAAK